MTDIKKRLLTVVALLICLGGILWIQYDECHYTRQGYIIHTVFDNYVVFVDDTGNEWNVFTDGQPFVDGQNVKATMFDNHTHTHIKDDEVVDLKFIN